MYGAFLAIEDLPAGMSSGREAQIPRIQTLVTNVIPFVGFNGTFYQNPVFDLAWQEKMINTTMNMNPTAMALCPIDASLEPIMREVQNRGIPYVTYAAGAAVAADLGVLIIVPDDVWTGQTAARMLIEAGATSGLCVNHVFGNLATTGYVPLCPWITRAL